jgi:hypothetical protein
VGDGPAHHRGASYALIALLGEALEALEAAGGGGPAAGADSVPVVLRPPPHLPMEGDDDGHFSLRMPTETADFLDVLVTAFEAPGASRGARGG